MQTVKTQHWTEVSWRNNVCTANFRVNTRLDHDFPVELTDIQ